MKVLAVSLALIVSIVIAAFGVVESITTERTTATGIMIQESDMLPKDDMLPKQDALPKDDALGIGAL